MRIIYPDTNSHESVMWGAPGKIGAEFTLDNNSLDIDYAEIVDYQSPVAVVIQITSIKCFPVDEIRTINTTIKKVLESAYGVVLEDWRIVDTDYDEYDLLNLVFYVSDDHKIITANIDAKLMLGDNRREEDKEEGYSDSAEFELILTNEEEKKFQRIINKLFEEQ